MAERGIKAAPRRQASSTSRKRCLHCGYDGHILQHQAITLCFICPQCGQDLYARPPKTYWELEGFVEQATLSNRQTPWWRRLIKRLIPDTLTRR